MIQHVYAAITSTNHPLHIIQSFMLPTLCPKTPFPIILHHHKLDYFKNVKLSKKDCCCYIVNASSVIYFGKNLLTTYYHAHYNGWDIWESYIKYSVNASGEHHHSVKEPRLHTGNMLDLKKMKIWNKWMKILVYYIAFSAIQLVEQCKIDGQH